MEYREKSEIRDGMRIDWDMPIKMEDGLVLRCDIYRPVADGKYPVIMTYGPYGKWLHFEDLYKDQWNRMCADQPDVPTGSTNKYQNWEVVDPEKWVPDGYICIRVDSRGAGRSPGVIDIWSLREAQDLAQCVDWAGVQPWSNGKVGLNGISYYAENQWQAAALQPKHLAAICTWEGAADFYRDMAHHGGIFCRGFVQDWSKAQVYTVQNGRGTRGFKSRMTGDWVSGPETLSEEQLGKSRRDFYEDCIARKLDTDEFWQSRMPDWNKVKVPLLSPPTGADKACIRAAISKASYAPPRSTNGSRSMASSTGRISIPTTVSICRSGSSATSSRAKTPAGASSRKCSCRCAIPARSSSSGMRTSGRWRARSGPSSISIPPT